MSSRHVRYDRLGMGCQPVKDQGRIHNWHWYRISTRAIPATVVIWNASTEWDSRAWCIVGIPEKERRLLRMGFECYTSWEKVISQRGDRCYRIGLIWRTTSYQDTHSTIRSRGHGTFIWILHGIQWTNSQCITQNCKRVYPASSEWRTPKVKCRGVPEGSKPP